MAKVTMLNMAGAEAGTIELKDEIFGITPNENAVHAVVKNYLANQRQGTQSAKTRGEVRGGGRKPFGRKEPVVTDKAARQTRHRSAAASYSRRSLVTTDIHYRRS